MSQPVIDFGMRGGGLFIEFNAEPGTVGRIHEAILEFHFLVDHILALRHIVEQRFMYAVAGSGNAKRKRNGIRHGARRIMRIEVKVWHAKNPERHVRDALGDDLVLLRVSDPCHAEVDRRRMIKVR